MRVVVPVRVGRGEDVPLVILIHLAVILIGTPDDLVDEVRRGRGRHPLPGVDPCRDTQYVRGQTRSVLLSVAVPTHA